MFRIFGILSLITLVASCALVDRAKENLFPQSAEGQKEQEIVARYGKPNNTRVAANGDRIIYYSGRCFQVSSGIVKSESTYSSPFYKIELKSLVAGANLGRFKGKTFSIFSGIKDTNSNDLEFKRNAAALAAILRLHGISEVVGRPPDYVILLSYGISDPHEDIDVSYKPTFAWVNGQNISTVGSVGGTSFSAQSTSNGHLEHTGYVPKYSRTVTYNRYMMINIYEHSSDISKAPQAFKLSLQSTGSSKKIDHISGLMFGPVQDYMLRAQTVKKKLRFGTMIRLLGWSMPTSNRGCAILV